MATCSTPQRSVDWDVQGLECITTGETEITRFEDAASKTARSFCKRCGTPLFYK
jgi:hypothetical protein